MNPLGQNFPQRELKSMSEIVYTSSMEIKQLSKRHECKVSCFLTNGLNSWYVYHVYDDYDRVTVLPINTNIRSNLRE